MRGEPARYAVSMRMLLLLIGLFGCVERVNTTALRDCDLSDPTVDCCERDIECDRYFGDSFPYCDDPGPQTGRCVECQVDEHCDLDSLCLDDPDHGRWCAPLSAAEP